MSSMRIILKFGLKEDELDAAAHRVAHHFGIRGGPKCLAHWCMRSLFSGSALPAMVGNDTCAWDLCFIENIGAKAFLKARRVTETLDHTVGDAKRIGVHPSCRRTAIQAEMKMDIGAVRRTFLSDHLRLRQLATLISPNRAADGRHRTGQAHFAVHVTGADHKLRSTCTTCRCDVVVDRELPNWSASLSEANPDWAWFTMRQGGNGAIERRQIVKPQQRC